MNTEGEYEEPELAEKFEQTKEKLQFPDVRAFREMLSAKLPSIPDSEKFFSRKKPTTKSKEKIVPEL